MSLLQERHQRISLKERGRLGRLSGVRGSLQLPNYPLKQCHSGQVSNFKSGLSDKTEAHFFALQASSFLKGFGATKRRTSHTCQLSLHEKLQAMSGFLTPC